MERGVTMKQGDVVAAQLVDDDFHFPPYHLFDSGEELSRRRATLVTVPQVLVEMLCHRIKRKNRFAECFAGYRAGLHAHTTQDSSALDECDFLSQFCGLDGGPLAGRPASDTE